MKRQDLQVSSHATVRFIQRICPGIRFTDAIERIHRLVNSPRLLAARQLLGGSRYKIIANGVVFCVQGGCVTTCFPRRRRPNHQQADFHPILLPRSSRAKALYEEWREPLRQIFKNPTTQRGRARTALVRVVGDERARDGH